MSKQIQSIKAERLLYLGTAFLLTLLGGSYWLIAWCLLLSFYLLTRLLKSPKWEKMIPLSFLSYSGLFLAGFILIRIFLWDYYLIPSNSMAPQLLPGDRVLVSKMACGPRLPTSLLDIPLANIFYKIRFVNKETPQPKPPPPKRIWQNNTQLQHRDLLVFNNPQTREVNIKRCVGIPGDTIAILFDQLFRNQKMITEEYTNLDFQRVRTRSEKPTPRNHSTVDDLLIPGKGISIPMNLKNFDLYQAIISEYEGKNIFLKREHVIIDGEIATSYTFTQDYYYLLGDNRHRSMDSRHWGLLPQSLIIGKAQCVLFSEPTEDHFFSRFLIGL